MNELNRIRKALCWLQCIVLLQGISILTMILRIHSLEKLVYSLNSLVYSVNGLVYSLNDVILSVCKWIFMHGCLHH